MIWLWIALLLAPLIAWIAHSIHLIQTPSTGPQIDRSNRPNTALLILDMQPCFLKNPAFAPKQIASVLANLTAQSTRPVIALQHEWTTPIGALLSRLTANGAGLPSRPDTPIHPQIAALADHTMTKPVQDAFQTGMLDRLLAQNNIGTVQIAGLDGIYCIHTTAHAALNRGYDVQIIMSSVLSIDPDKQNRCFERLKLRGAKIVIQAP